MYRMYLNSSRNTLRNARSLLSGIALLILLGGLCMSNAAAADSSDAIVRAEFIYAEAPFRSCHASTLVEVAPGTILAAWFGGTDEGENDVAIWGARLEGGQWGPVREWARAEGVPCWNPALFHTEEGETLLFYKAGENPRSWSGLVKRSFDAGKTWSKAELLPAGILGPIKNKPIQLDDGTLVCGSSVESWRAWACWVELTKDGGRTWTKHGPIEVPNHPMGIIQPTMFETREGNLRFLCRATRSIGKICLAESRDGGKTWSDARPIDLPNPNSGIDAVRMHDGRIALIYNHTPSARSPLNLGISDDDGETWEMALTLEDQPGEYSYPAVIQSKDGKLHITYTWKRQRIKYVVVDPDEL